MVARLLRDKGVNEFVEAARLLRARGVPVSMRLVGGVDAGNPASATQQDVEAWQTEGCVQALGERSDVPGLYAASHIAVLPSYREGLPKSLIEAAACGRAVVTTDVPGCRDAIEPDKTACWCRCATPARWRPSPGWRPIRRCAARWALRTRPGRA